MGARKDNIPFSAHDWHCLREYMSEWTEVIGEAEENRRELNDQMLAPAALKKFVLAHLEDHPIAFLHLQFPQGSTVVAEGLSVAELNGKEGTVVQYGRNRVGIRFEALPERGVVAIKPDRLKVLREPSEAVGVDMGGCAQSGEEIARAKR